MYLNRVLEDDMITIYGLIRTWDVFKLVTAPFSYIVSTWLIRTWDVFK